MTFPFLTYKIRTLFILFVIMSGAAVNSAFAAQNGIGSCYSAIKINDIETPSLKRELFVIVDQTVVFNKEIQEQVFNKIMTFLSPGDRVIIISFSAYAANRYTDVVFDGTIDTRLKDDVRYDISKKTLRVLDHCFQIQETGVRQGIRKSLLSIFKNASIKLPVTELIGTLSLLGQDVMQPVQLDKKYVLIVSDMLENSALTSFYGKNKLSHINIKAILNKTKKSNMLPDFKGAKIYVVGAAYSPNGAYRSAMEIKSLETFWRAYFQASNAQVKEFGAPSLIREIGK